MTTILSPSRFISFQWCVVVPMASALAGYEGARTWLFRRLPVISNGVVLFALVGMLLLLLAMWLIVLLSVPNSVTLRDGGLAMLRPGAIESLDWTDVHEAWKGWEPPLYPRWTFHLTGGRTVGLETMGLSGEEKRLLDSHISAGLGERVHRRRFLSLFR